MAGTFALDLTAFCNKYDADLKMVVRKITFEVFQRVVLRTPVDTGAARANWGLSVDKPDITYHITDGDKTGTATLAKLTDGVQAWRCAGSIFMTNNLPYIGVLEYGRANGTWGSKQAPNGMVRITLEEMQTWIQSML